MPQGTTTHTHLQNTLHSSVVRSIYKHIFMLTTLTSAIWNDYLVDVSKLTGTYYRRLILVVRLNLLRCEIKSEMENQWKGFLFSLIQTATRDQKSQMSIEIRL